MTARLDEICGDVGKEVFDSWINRAVKDYEASPYLYRGADAKQAFIYSAILHRYEKFKEIERALECARKVC